MQYLVVPQTIYTVMTKRLNKAGISAASRKIETTEGVTLELLGIKDASCANIPISTMPNITIVFDLGGETNENVTLQIATQSLMTQIGASCYFAISNGGSIPTIYLG